MTNDVMFIIPPEAKGQRVDMFLAGQAGIATRNIAQKLLSQGHVTLAGKPLEKKHKVTPGETLICHIPPPRPLDAAPENIPLDIIYEDDSLLVINKPRGLVAHPGAGNWEGTLVNALLHHCQGNLSGIGGVLRPGIVHSLDKDTYGLMVVAKNDQAHQGLAAQLESRTMLREYTAICCGLPPQDKIKISAPIGRHPMSRTKMAILEAGGREATTYVTIQQRFQKHSLITARLETGRTHQIRVHMAYIKHPILGDTVYGSPNQPQFLPKDSGQILHALQVGFVHPITGADMSFTAPLPPIFQQALEALHPQ